MSNQCITVVIEYPNKEAFYASEFRSNMKLCGGKVIAVQFNDALEEADKLRERVEELEDKYVL